MLLERMGLLSGILILAMLGPANGLLLSGWGIARIFPAGRARAMTIIEWSRFGG